MGFQLKRVRGRQETSFFNWNITDPPALLSLLQHDFAGILQSENLSLHGGGSLIHDTSHDFMVHHEFDVVLFKEAPNYFEKLDRLREKFTYFSKLFRKTAASRGSTAYFYKCGEAGAKEIALSIQNLLLRYHGENPFDIIMIQEQSVYEPDWALPGIHNRYLRRFAPYDDTPDAHIVSWDMVFREFPHKKPLSLINYM